MKRPLAISLSPNTTGKDTILALSLFFSPWRYQWGSSVKLLEQWFREYFSISYAISFASGRTALFAILKEMNIGAGDEVVLQAFTCVAVPNSVLWTGAKPIYVDIASSLTMDVKDLEGKITKKTKAIIVQHTFGIPSDLASIQKIAKKHGLFVIEDCAHVIGGVYKSKKLGLFSDASFFSFGRDKAFSSIFGGMVITNNKTLGKKIRAYQRQLDNPSFLWIAQQLFHPIAFYFILPLYTLFIGKLFLALFQKLHFLSFPVSQKEKRGEVEKSLIKKLPNALACLALFQLRRIYSFNKKRQDIASIYMQDLKDSKVDLPADKTAVFLRFPILSTRRDKLLGEFRKKNVYLGNWYLSAVDPAGVDFKKIGYTKGLCPMAESVCEKIVNLPTYPTMDVSDAKKIVSLVKQYAYD